MNQPTTQSSQQTSIQPVSSIIRVLFGILVLITLVTQGEFDPSPFNPVWPAQGVSNFLGLFGALFAGFLFDFFGFVAYLIPITFLVFQNRQKEALLGVLLKTGILLFSPSLLVALFFIQESTMLTQYTGLWGVGIHSLFPNLAWRILPFFPLAIAYIKIVRQLRFNWFFLALFLGSWSFFLQILNSTQKQYQKIRFSLWEYILQLKQILSTYLLQLDFFQSRYFREFFSFVSLRVLHPFSSAWKKITFFFTQHTTETLRSRRKKRDQKLTNQSQTPLSQTNFPNSPSSQIPPLPKKKGTFPPLGPSESVFHQAVNEFKKNYDIDLSQSPSGVDSIFDDILEDEEKKDKKSS